MELSRVLQQSIHANVSVHTRAMSQFDLNTGDALTKVKFLVSVLRIRLHEFFCDFDGLRCGYITQTQFKSGLSMSGLSRFIAAGELDNLTAQFVDEEDKQKRVKYAYVCLLLSYSPCVPSVDTANHHTIRTG